MAKLVEDVTHKPKHRSSCFLDCFGFPGKDSEKKLLPDIVKSGSHRKNTRWLSRWSFHLKKSAAKTAPVNATLPGKRNWNTEIHPLKSSDQKLSSKFHTPVAGNKPAEIQVVESDQNLPQKANERSKNPTNIILGNRAESKKGDTRQNGVFSCRKKGAKAKTLDDPMPPVKKKSAITRSKSQPAIFQSTDFPPPKPKKPAASKDKDNRKHSKSAADEFDSVVGMSIIMVTLVIMLIWGKLSAILCTSAWFFLIPRLRKTMESYVATEKGSNYDLNSEEYKKKVVLEGFLTRNQRKFVNFL